MIICNQSVALHSYQPDAAAQLLEPGGTNGRPTQKPNGQAARAVPHNRFALALFALERVLVPRWLLCSGPKGAQFLDHRTELVQFSQVHANYVLKFKTILGSLNVAGSKPRDTGNDV